MSQTNPMAASALPAHGGNLGAAARRFPGAPGPWLDLSTGISPYPYSVRLPPEAWTRLPEPDAEAALLEVAARRYGAPSAAHVVAAPGTEILLPMLARLAPPGAALVLGPTYAGHAQAARQAGRAVGEVTSLEALTGPCNSLVNPNNPDGRLLPRAALLGRRFLVVDEAYMDATDGTQSLAGDVDQGGLVVLRSFGKFFGLAGLRLGFAITDVAMAARLRAELGAWAVSGPALAIGTAALADAAWTARTRSRLAAQATKLDAVLVAGGLQVVGGTTLFRLAEAPPGTFEQLAQAGILTRPFDYWPGRLRFGLPPDDAGLARLAAALARLAAAR